MSPQRRFRRILPFALVAVVLAAPAAQARNGDGSRAVSNLRIAFVSVKGAKLDRQRAQLSRTSIRRLVAAGPSLVSNGSFEGSLAGWAGWTASLSLASDGFSGPGAARVAAAGATSYSIFPTKRPVTSSPAGAAYSAAGAVRSDRAGRTVCLRVREWVADSLVGSAQSCAATAATWQRFPALAYTAARTGSQLDVYAYQLAATAGDSFELDALELRQTAGTQDPVPTPVPAPAPAPAPAPTPAPVVGPGGLSATPVDHAHVRLAWNPVAGAASYRVSRSGAVLGTTTGATFTDALLWPATTYNYTVEALSSAGAVLSSRATSAATKLLPADGFPRPFASTSFWNLPVGNAPIHANSAGMISYFAANARNPNLPLRSWAVGVAESRPSDPTYSVPCLKYSCTLSAFGAFAVPTTAKADPSADGHLAVYDPATGREWDMWQAKWTGATWTSSAGAAVSMAADGVAPGGTASGNAANLPLLGGIIRPEEMLQGRIDHALVFEMPGVGAGRPVCPATHNAGSATDPNALREGQKLQLDPAVDVDALPIPAWQKTIARAMQRYGMYLRDGSGSLAVLAENPASRGYDAWTLAGLGSASSPSIAGLPWNRFRVLAAPDC